ncbi:unnamed protein product, partial [Gulo gulo]
HVVTGRPAVSAVTVWRREGGGGGSAVGKKASREEWPFLRPEQRPAVARKPWAWGPTGRAGLSTLLKSECLGVYEKERT